MPAAPSKDAMPRADLRTIEKFDLEMQRRNYIGTRVMPVFPVRARTGRFGKISLSSLLAAGGEKIERAAKSGYSRGDWSFTQDSFITQARGVEEEIDDDEKIIYGTMFDAELIAVQRAYDRLFSAYDSRIVAAAVDATVTAGYTNAAAATWGTSVSASPRTDVKTGKKAMWDRTGMVPNTLVISEWRFEDLKDVDEVVERMTASGAGEQARPDQITEAKLAEILGVDQVLVARAIEFDGSTVTSKFPDDKALLLRTPTTQSLREPCYGRTFVYEGVYGDFEPVPETYRQETIMCDIVRLAHESEEKILYPEMAQVITGIG